jgi:hypothetical protein
VPLGHGTALAALAAGPETPGRSVGAAPAAWVLPVDVQENLSVAPGRAGTPDPRMRSGPELRRLRLRSPLWARAAGVVYAVTEGVRILTCAWPADLPAHLILHDALTYAEDNCVLPVCALEPPEPRDGRTSALVQWRKSWLRTRGAGSGAVVDGWTGERVSDFVDRPLRATLLVGGGDPETGMPLGMPPSPPDLFAPGKALSSAVSSPRNDGSPALDVRMAPLSGSAPAAALAAGVAALVVGARPDLEPHAVREVLLAGAVRQNGRPWLDAEGALRESETASRGLCMPLDSRRAAEKAGDRPFWKRIRLDVSRPKPKGVPGPASNRRWP